MTMIDANRDRMTPTMLRSATETPVKPKKKTPVTAISKKIIFFLFISSSELLKDRYKLYNYNR
jgi:hypothetical protein